MSKLTQTDMQRELHNYAMAEMRNRGLEEAAQYLAWRAEQSRNAGDRYELLNAVAQIRALKTNPSECLSDWWAEDKPAQAAADVQ